MAAARTCTLRKLGKKLSARNRTQIVLAVEELPSKPKWYDFE